MTKITYIPGEIANAAIDEHGNRKPVTRTHHIFDDNLEKPQNEVNQERIEDVATLDGKIALEKQRAEGVESGLNNRLGTVEQLAEISIGGGDAQIATGADFTNPDAIKRAKVPTVGAIVDGLNDGVYDVTKRNPTAGPNSDGKFTLEYILSNADTLIPTGWRHGGMLISFVDSSDNKYIQARLMADSFTTDVSQWQCSTSEIKADSKDLAESDAVAKSIQDTVDKYLPTKEWKQLTSVEKTDGKQWVSDGAGGITLSGQSNRTAVKFDAVAGQKYYVQGYNTGTNSNYAIYFLNSSGKIIDGSTISSATPETIEGNTRCIQFTTPSSCVYVAYTAYTNSSYDLQKIEESAPLEKQEGILNLTDVKYINEAVKDSINTTINLYNSSDVNTDKEIDKNGELVVSDGKTATNYIPVESIFTFTYITQGPSILCAFYDKNKNFISILTTASVTLIDNSYYIIYPPSGTKFVRIAHRTSATSKKLCPWFYPSVSLNYNQTYTRTIQEGLIPTSIQRVQDNSLNTENKTVPGAINEINNSYSKNTSKETYLHEVKGEFLLDEDWFEKGTITFNSDSYVYGNNNDRIRTKQGVFVRLEKGDKICKKDKYLSMNCGLIDDEENYFRITDRDSEGNTICKYTGNYMLVFLYPDGTPVGEVSDLLKKIYIVRKEQAVPSIVEYNQDEIEKLLALSCTSYPNTDTPSVKQKRRRFTSLIMTDLHGDADRVKRFVQLYNTMYAYVDLGINLGDIPSTVWNAEGDNPTWYTDIVAKCKNNVWGVIGNHEINGAESISVERLTSQQAFEKFIAPLNLGLETNTPYYSKRFDDYGVTAIVLNCYDWPDDTYPYGTNTWIICQTQFDWLVNVLANVPANDTVIVFMHAMGKTLVPDNSAFSSTMIDNNGDRILPAGWYDAYFSAGLFGIIDAWQNHTSFSYNQTHEDISVSINVDFSSRGEGKFAGFFVGHEHTDMVGHVNNYPNQNVFCFNSSSVDKALTGDLVRNLGQKNEDALTAFTVDTQGRKVHLLRFGANFTVNGELRSYASYTY